jgi:hypothetical protein
VHGNASGLLQKRLAPSPLTFQFSVRPAAWAHRREVRPGVPMREHDIESPGRSAGRPRLCEEVTADYEATHSPA